MALASSNNATKYIYKGFLSMYKNSSALLLRFIQTYSKNNNIKKKIESAIGYKNIDIIEELYDIDSRSFIVTIDLSMNQEEKQMLYEDVKIAIENGQIDITDKIDIMSSRNIKYANLMLKEKKKKIAIQAQKRFQQKKIQERQDEMAKMKMEIQKESHKEKMKFQMEQKGKSLDLQRELKKEEMENKLYRIKRKIDAFYKIKEISAQAGTSKENIKYKEDREDKRVDMKDENESRHIEQRQKETGAMKFPQKGGLSE